MEQQEEKSIVWTPEKLVRLENAYEKATHTATSMDETFEFEDNVFVLSYAKYLITYLNTVLKK